MKNKIYYNVTITQENEKKQVNNYIIDIDFKTLNQAQNFAFTSLKGLCYNDKPNTTINLYMVYEYKGIRNNKNDYILLEKFETKNV